MTPFINQNDCKNVNKITTILFMTILRTVIEIKWLQDQIAAQEEWLEHLRLEQIRISDRAREGRRKFKSLLPNSSDIICQGTHRSNRTCRVKNLCLATKENSFFILKSPSSLQVNTPDFIEAEPVLDLTTLDAHNVFYWRYDEAAGDFFTAHPEKWSLNVVDVGESGGGIGMPKRVPIGSFSAALNGPVRKNLTIVKGRTYITMRFYPVNIMHVFHDDWLGMYHLRDLWPSLVDPFDEYYYSNETEWASSGFTSGNRTHNPTSFRRKKKAHGLTVFDHHPAREYDIVYDWLGNFQRLEPLLGWKDWSWKKQERPDAYICFQDAVVGNSKGLAWYQYGYGKPQGPIPGHTATGWKLREAALYILRQLELSAWKMDAQQAIAKSILSTPDRRNLRNKLMKQNKDACIAIFSRKSTRLILNELELQAHLEGRFGLPVCWLRLEDLTIPQIIAKLRNAVMAFGMHGSLLILCMFLPPGAVLVEGYPYGVPAENYTPYREMARLPGMRLAYRSWTAPTQSHCIAHPERHARAGGLGHLNETYRHFITNASTIPLHHCCDNPHWLYRIFQDTRVEVREIGDLLEEGLREMHQIS